MFYLSTYDDPALLNKDNYTRVDDRCYSYPVFYSLMKNRRKTDYMTVFEDLKYYYNHFTKNNLEDILTKIKLDCELACLGALDALFPECTILLCRIHIIRNWAKWFKHYVCQTFFKNKYYASIFRFFWASHLWTYVIRIF